MLRVQMQLLQMLMTVRSQMDEMEVKNILKRYSDKKTEREKNERAHLAHFWSGLKYMCKA